MRKGSKRMSVRKNRRSEESNNTRANARQRDPSLGTSSSYPGGIQFDEPQVEQLHSWSHPVPAPAGVPSERHHVFGLGFEVDPCVGPDLGISESAFPAREQTPPNGVPAAPLPIQGAANGSQGRQEGPLSNVGQPRGASDPNPPQASIQPSGIGGRRFEPRQASNYAGGIQRTHPQRRASRNSHVPRPTWPTMRVPSSHWPEWPIPDGPNHGYATGYPADTSLPASGDMTNVTTVDPRLLFLYPVSPSSQNIGNGGNSGNPSNVPEQYDGGHPPQP